jgi:hypothetical protein
MSTHEQNKRCLPQSSRFPVFKVRDWLLIPPVSFDIEQVSFVLETVGLKRSLDSDGS